MTNLQAWLSAFRLRTLPLALASIFLGSFLAGYNDVFRWQILLLSAITTILLQILSNLANDYGDSVHGADHNERKGPARAVQSGLIPLKTMKKAMGLFVGLSLISGILLLYVSFGFNVVLFFTFLTIGLLAIAAAVFYTSGKRPYGYAGLGDVSVLLFFGFVGVLGTYYLYSSAFDFANIWLAATSGLFATAVLNINNIRDIESDRIAGKRSIPVRIGRKKAVLYHWLLLSLGWLCAFMFTVNHYKSPVQLIFVLSLPLFILNGWQVAKKKDAVSLDPFLKQMALSTLLFVILFGVGLILS